MRSALLALALAACSIGSTSAPSPAPVDDPQDDAIADAGATPMAPAEPGLVSEEAFKAAHTLNEGEVAALSGAMVSLPGGTQAYLSLPDHADASTPGVVVIHEWWGLNDHVKHWADRLADEGYAALAVDLYGGQVATTRDEAMGLMKQVDSEAALSTLRDAHLYLRTAEAIRAERTGSIGWCFGGGWSLQLAIAEPELDAAVIYYGRLEQDPATLESVQAPILGHFALNDAGIPRESVQGFHDALKGLGKPVSVHMYDADHAFANPSSARYDAVDAEKAWEETRRFLDAQLKGLTRSP